ncbi:MAG TPA: hypothetical protein VMJ12_06005 [Candidatus Acidoferrales bacterium]|nr:hypothetical protein [Candidatus Acidoferrales bacterium]
MKRNLPTFLCAGLLLWAIGIMTAQADTVITFSVNMVTNLANGSFNPPPPAGTGSDAVYVNGTFYAWSGNGLQLVQEGNSTIWTNSYDDTTDANGHVVSYRFRLASASVGTGYESTASWDNRAAQLPTTSGASLVLTTPYYGDVGPGQIVNVKFQMDMSEEIQLGHFTNGVNQLDVRGSFNGWANVGDYLTRDPSILVTNVGGIVTSNVYTGAFAITTGAEVSGVPATNAFMEWKAVEDVGSGNSVSSWETPGPTTANDAVNRFWNNDTNRVLPIVSFSDLPYAPVANVTLNVDMSGVIKYDPNYVPNSVTVWGTFNNWASGVTMTINPSPNTNIFSSPVITMPENVPVILQVRYTNSLVGGWVYDYVNDSVYNDNARRTITFPITATALNTNVPAFYFLDLALNDYLPKATPVLFSVDMNGAVDTNGYVFIPSSDSVYINGMFANGGGTPYPQAWYPWSGGVNPVSAPPGYQMIREGSSTIYTNTISIPAGTPVALSYQYGIDPGSFNGGPLEDEAPTGANHFRVVRVTSGNLYSMPVDTFTNQPYQEPLFAPGNIYEGMGTLAGGHLSVGTPVAGAAPVSWLGRPGAHLQSATSLNGPWTEIWNTDGTNWTSGVNTTNGLMSVTNWPSASGTTFFRLVKP